MDIRGAIPTAGLDDGVVTVEAGVITRVTAATGAAPPPAGVILPGLIDIHCHGGGGHSFATCDPAEALAAAEYHAAAGTTRILASLVTAAPPVLLGQVRTLAPLVASGRLEGIHLEGPFLAPARRGAHDPAALLDPTPERVEALLKAAGGHKREAPTTAAGDHRQPSGRPPTDRTVLALVTLAPELAGGLEAVKRFTAAGVVVSVGHSDAVAGQVAAAADAGARMITHVFNAQRGLHHREPGVAGQALADERLTVGLIADLHHVHPAVCRVVLAAAGGRVALVTDAAAPAGMPPGRYQLGGEPVELGPEGPPRRADGTIAGSALRLDQAVGNLVGLGVDLAVAVEAASRVPADLLGRADLGRIETGALADLAWLSDTHHTLATWIGGEQAWRA